MDHGVIINEVPTGVAPPVSVTAGLPVYVGTAPINLGDPTNVNKPVLISTLAEAVDKLGYLDGVSWSEWTLFEAISAHFKVYKVGPIVCINVIDPTKTEHHAEVTGESHVLDSKGNATLQIYGDAPTFGVLLDSVVVKLSSVTKRLGTDYTLAFDDSGLCVVSRVAGGTIPALSTIEVDYNYLDPSGVVANDIIGGYSAGKYKGIAAIDQVYPRLRLVPGFALAPKWSQVPEVEAALVSAVHAIDGSFRAMALCDLSTDPESIPSYSDAPGWKSDNAFDALDLAVFWPKFKNGSDVYHLSTVAACIANLVDNNNVGVPFASPSNQLLTGTAAVLDDGTEVLLTKLQANILNGQGIVTALNGFNGWKLWGNRTAAYPGTTDPKDAFIAVRRMFNWMGVTIILTTDRDVDQPGNKRLIEGVVGTLQLWLNGLIAIGALLAGAKIEFRKDENPTTDLENGIIRWHVTATPPSPGEVLDFILEYDPNALSALFA